MIQFKRQTTELPQGWETSNGGLKRDVEVQLIDTEQKRTKSEEQVVIGDDGKPVIDPTTGKPQLKKVKGERDVYPFLAESDLSIERLVMIFGRETVQNQLTVAFSRIFQQLWFKNSEKVEAKFIGFLEAEDFGSVRERTSKTIGAEIIALMKTPTKANIEKAMSLQVELGEVLAAEMQAMSAKLS